MDKIEHIAAVIKLYDELEELKNKNAYLVYDTEEPKCEPRVVSPMDLIAIEEGKKVLVETFFDGWYFKSYGPKVYDSEAGFTEDNIKSFDEYYKSIGPRAFDTEKLIQIFCQGGVSFDQFKAYFKDKIYELYEKKVSERLREVAQENEDVRATEE